MLRLRVSQFVGLALEVLRPLTTNLSKLVITNISKLAAVAFITQFPLRLTT